MARRKNASFTLDQTYGSGRADRSLIQAFYEYLDLRYFGDTPVPIPPASNVRPTHPAQTQALICADYIVRKFAPIALRAAGMVKEAQTLEKLPRVQNDKTADTAGAAATRVARIVDDAASTALRAQAAERRAQAAEGPRDPLRALLTRSRTQSTAVNTLSTASMIVSNAAVIADMAVYNTARLPNTLGGVVYEAAKLDPDATWAAVNEMLQAL